MQSANDDRNQLTLYSETDSHGTIIFVNDTFCKVSKYAREELMGCPHNIIRHPDMPGELFKRLWDSIRKGGVFRGVIKNKTKDGNHYWVQATIMPVRGTTESINYAGVRHLITNDRIAEELFRQQVESKNQF